MRKPDLELFDPGAMEPYMRRWWLIPRNSVFNIYLHRIGADDPGEHLHDHPWWNVSIIVKGRYRELYARRPMDASDPALWSMRRSIRFVPYFRRGERAHKLIVEDGPVWSLFVTGRKRRNWGFWVGESWVHHEFYDHPRLKVSE